MAGVRVRTLLSLLVVTCLVVLHSIHCSGRLGTDTDEHESAATATTLLALHRQPAAAPTVPAPASVLDASRLNTVRMAGMVDTAYVRLPVDRSVDPYRGGRTEDGEFGYRADEKFLRRRHRQQQTEFVLTQNELDDVCTEWDGTYTMLTEKVRLANRAHDEGVSAADASSSTSTSTTPSPRILCVLFVVEQDHDRMDSIHNTWGPKCDGMIVGSNKTDRRIGAVDIPHEGPEAYDNIWQKVRSLWFYIYDNYYEDYDYFHSGGSDLYLLVDNLREYLVSREIRAASNGGIDTDPQASSGNGDGGGGDGETSKPSTYHTPLYLGRRFALDGDRNEIFVGGSGGYTINRAALKLLVLSLPHCEPHTQIFAEDVMMARCLKQFGVLPYDTKDSSGGERYHPFTPSVHLAVFNDSDVAKRDNWYLKYCIDCKWGIDHCSSQSISFHGVKPPLMKRMHAILHGYCN